MTQNLDATLSHPLTSDAQPAAGAGEERPLWPSILRGWRCRCPQCGSGPLLSGYLKVRDTCPVCGEDLHHQRADDGPAYVTILVVGHILAPVLLFIYSKYDPDPLITASLMSVACVALCLFLLPRIKGAFVGLQWAKRMHGFGNGRSS